MIDLQIKNETRLAERRSRRFFPRPVLAFAFFFTVVATTDVTNTGAQITMTPAGTIVHRKAMTISEIQREGIGKLYREPSPTIYHRTGAYGKLWIPPGQRYRSIAFLQTLYMGAVSNTHFDPGSLQLGALIGGSHGTASVLNVLSQERIQSALDIDRKQAEAIRRLGEELRKSVDGDMAALRERNPRLSEEEFAIALLGSTERFSTSLRESLQKVVTEDQMYLAKEIVFLMSGGFETAVVDLDILDLFDLTKEQREKLELIAEEANKKRAGLFAGFRLSQIGPRDLELIHHRLREIARVNAQKIRAILDENQKAFAAELREQGDLLEKELQKR